MSRRQYYLKLSEQYLKMPPIEIVGFALMYIEDLSEIDSATHYSLPIETVKEMKSRHLGMNLGIGLINLERLLRQVALH